MSDEKMWYVVAREPAEGDGHVYVFGEFVNETDSRTFALDLQNDNDGWETIEALEMSRVAAESVSTDGRVLWPYHEDQPQ